MSKFKLPVGTDNKLIGEMLNNPNEKNVDKYYETLSKDMGAAFNTFNKEPGKCINLIQWLQDKDNSKDLLNLLDMWDMFGC